MQKTIARRSCDATRATRRVTTCAGLRRRHLSQYSHTYFLQSARYCSRPQPTGTTMTPALRTAAAAALFLCFLHPQPIHSVAEFNYEVEKRIVDRIDYYMSQAVETNVFISNFRYSGGFPNYMAAQDRDEYLVVDNSLPMPLLYYGLEDGSITGYYKGGEASMGYYREPGNSGYSVDEPSTQKHLKSCIDKNDGTPTDCLLSPGDDYIQCVDEDCNKTELCPDADSQADCSIIDDAEQAEQCMAKQKWCIQYTIETVSEDDDTKRGYVPLTNYCHDIRGQFTQDIGKVVKGYTPSTYNLAAVVNPADGSSSVHTLGNCYYGDGTTLVNRTISGDYAYCGSYGEVCDTTFIGGYESNEYDPRYRPWYINAKRDQKPMWNDPYPFFDLGLGITATHPIYDIVDGKNVFAGVLAVDYRFEDIATFLVESYGSSDTAVAIFEDKDPNYIIALSTGTPANSLVLSADPTKPCPVTSGTDVPCDPVRVKMSELTGTTSDSILVKAFRQHMDAEYPKELIRIQASDAVDSKIYLSQSALYEQPDANLRWRVVVASPGERSDSDSIEIGNPLFGTLLAIGALGFAICVGLFGVFYRKRRKRAVIYADWRFTCAFLIGCGIFNLSTLTLVGPNTSPMCILRMWSFHFLFVVALAPLFVKVWRMWKLVGSSSIQRKSISNQKAATYMLPMIAVQFIILLIISIVDPPLQTEETEINEGVMTHHIVCAHDTNALAITEIMYEAGLVFVGCVLAFQTRHMDERFGESKQLIFAMYTWALIGVSFLIVASVAQITPNGISILQGIGVFWVTVFSSAAFVIPRIIQVRMDDSSGRRSSRISGFNSMMTRVSINRRLSQSASSVDPMPEKGDAEMGGETPSFLAEPERSPAKRAVTFEDEKG